MPETRFTDIRRFESIDSTNRYLLDEARNGAPEGVVVVADHQSSGRGRLGRHWEAPPGSNLLASVLLRPDLAPADRHLATAVVALAAIDAIVTETGMAPGIKWPNDLVGPGYRKLAGVLAEADMGSNATGGVGAMCPAIVVGIGVNVGWPLSDGDLPDDLVGIATSLRQETGRPVDRTALLHRLLAALEPRVAALGSVDGRARLGSDLRRHCTTIGERVRVDLLDESFEGTAIDVTAEGHLIVDVGVCMRTVVAGDVIHLRPIGDTRHAPGSFGSHE